MAEEVEGAEFGEGIEVEAKEPESPVATTTVLDGMDETKREAWLDFIADAEDKGYSTSDAVDLISAGYSAEQAKRKLEEELVVRNAADATAATDQPSADEDDSPPLTEAGYAKRREAERKRDEAARQVDQSHQTQIERLGLNAVQAKMVRGSVEYAKDDPQFRNLTLGQLYDVCGKAYAMTGKATAEPKSPAKEQPGGEPEKTETASPEPVPRSTPQRRGTGASFEATKHEGDDWKPPSQDRARWRKEFTQPLEIS